MSESNKGSCPGLGPEVLITYAAVFNTLNGQRHLIRRRILWQLRAEAGATWTAATAAA